VPSFSLKPGEISGRFWPPQWRGRPASSRGRSPPIQEFAAKKDEIRQSLLEAKQNDLFGLFVTNLRKDMGKNQPPQVNQEEMKNLTRQGAQEGS